MAAGALVSHDTAHADLVLTPLMVVHGYHRWKSSQVVPVWIVRNPYDALERKREKEKVKGKIEGDENKIKGGYLDPADHLF
jgi:hypothetical protein